MCAHASIMEIKGVGGNCLFCARIRKLISRLTTRYKDRATLVRISDRDRADIGLTPEHLHVSLDHRVLDQRTNGQLWTDHSLF